MPWHIITHEGQHCVAKEGEDAPIDGGCHATEKEAENHMAALYANVNEAKDVLTFRGGEVKALENGKVAGYLVTFSDETSPDLAGDFFQKDTDFGTQTTSPTLYNHGMDVKIGTKMIGQAKLAFDDVGVWIEAQIDLADRYAKAIYELAKKGKLGWSSGTASHLVTREKVGKANKILTWPLGIDASLTPIPAEPRNVAISLKSMQFTEFTEPEAEGNEAAQTTNDSKNKTIKGIDMTEQEKKEAEAVTAPAPDAASTKNIFEKVQAEMDQENAIKAQKQKQDDELEEGIRGLLESVKAKGPATNGGSPSILKIKRGDSEMKAFEHYLRTGDEKAYKTTYYLNEAVDEEGMATAPKDFYAQIVNKLVLQSFPRAAGARSIITSSRAVDIPVQNTQWDAPASTIESKTSTQTAASVNAVATPFDTLTVTPVKYTRIVLLSDEYLNDDKANVTSMIADTLADQFGVLENALAVTELTAGVSVSVTAAAAATIAAGDVTSLYYKVSQPYRNGRQTAWVSEGSTEGAIRGITGSPFLFAQTPQGTINTAGGFVDPLMGRPLYNAATVTAIGASAKSLWFGNFNYLGMVTNGGLTIRRLNELYAASGQVAFLFSQRIAFKTLQPEAFAFLVHPSA